MLAILVIMFGALLFLATSWKIAVMLLGTLFVLFAVKLITSQESMLYVPCVRSGMQTPSDNPPGYQSPADRLMAFEEVYVTTVDDLRIHAWFIPAKENSRKAPTILFCHANAGNIGLRVPNFAEIVEKLGANILAFDYRGYGSSEGSPFEEGLIADALAAWGWLDAAADEGRIDGERIFVFGRSLGGAVAIALACILQKRDNRLPCGMILENTFTSISDLVDTLFPIFAFDALKKRFLNLKWESIDRVKDIEVPLLFLTGEKDEIVPPSQSAALQAQAVKARVRRQVLFPEGMHNDTYEKGGDKYWQAWSEFFVECCAAGSMKKGAES